MLYNVEPAVEVQGRAWYHTDQKRDLNDPESEPGPQFNTNYVETMRTLTLRFLRTKVSEWLDLASDLSCSHRAEKVQAPQKWASTFASHVTWSSMCHARTLVHFISGFAH